MKMICFGQTYVNANASIDDPPPNAMPEFVKNQVLKLPYVVPAGKELILGTYGCEGQHGPVTALFPWLGDYPAGANADQKTDWRKTHALMSCASPSGSHEQLGAEVTILPGTTIHVRLTNAASPGKTLAWYLCWELVDAEIVTRTSTRARKRGRDARRGRHS